jgi:hypothetical protein
MAKRGGGANPTHDTGQAAASRAIAAHERSIKARKRELEVAGHQPPATRRHLCLMLARQREGLAKEYRALAREHG